MIILALALCILSTLRLMEKITVRHVVILTVSLMALLSLRFYIFYMMAAAVAGSFIIGMKTLSAQSFMHTVYRSRSDWTRLYVVWRASVRGSAV